MDTPVAPTAAALAARSVTVRAPGRLHLGFLDPAATLGRRFGSIGLVIDGFETEVSLSAATSDQRSAADDAARSELDRAADMLESLRVRTGLRQPLHLHLAAVLPAHAGFGSGTQLALAIGRAFARWHGLSPSTPEIAQWLGRGVRSGVGIAGFDQGGLLVDGGPSADGRPAPLLARVEMPQAWRIVLLQDERRNGLSGSREREAIAALAPLAQADAADICHQVLMRVLPGAACGDFGAFAAGITRVQQVLGAHFSAAQDGRAYASAAVDRAMRWVAEASGEPAAIGQTSWGPTAFAVLPSADRAKALVDALASSGAFDAAALGVRVVAARNHGATVIDRLPPPQAF